MGMFKKTKYSAICKVLPEVFLFARISHFTVLIIEAVVQRCSVKKGVLKNFAKFTGKHLCQFLFLIKLQVLQNFRTTELT